MNFPIQGTSDSSGIGIEKVLSSREGKSGIWPGLITVLTVVALALPGPSAAQEPEEHETAGEHEEGAEHGEEHEFHKNHFAVFIGSTEAVEEHDDGHGDGQPIT